MGAVASLPSPFALFSRSFSQFTLSPLSRSLEQAIIRVALAPIFAQPKSEKRLERAESPTETLATKAKFIKLRPPSDRG